MRLVKSRGVLTLVALLALTCIFQNCSFFISGEPYEGMQYASLSRTSMSGSQLDCSPASLGPLTFMNLTVINGTGQATIHYSDGGTAKYQTLAILPRPGVQVINAELPNIGTVKSLDFNWAPGPAYVVFVDPLSVETRYQFTCR